MIRRLFVLVLLIIIGYFLGTAMASIPFGAEKVDVGPYRSVGNYYVDNTVQETGGVNAVTSIVVLYRGFDTLGEVTVLFLAATGLAAILALTRERRKLKKEKPSLIMRVGTDYLFPAAIVLGSYVFLHGHLTPGGGFPGGVIIASGFLMLFLAQWRYKVDELGLKIIESLAGMTYVTIGLIGLLKMGTFLGNFLGKGTPGALLSAGIIPVIYIVIGIKVGSEMTGLLQNLRETTENE